MIKFICSLALLILFTTVLILFTSSPLAVLILFTTVLILFTIRKNRFSTISLLTVLNIVLYWLLIIRNSCNQKVDTLLDCYSKFGLCILTMTSSYYTYLYTVLLSLLLHILLMYTIGFVVWFKGAFERSKDLNISTKNYNYPWIWNRRVNTKSSLFYNTNSCKYRANYTIKNFSSCNVNKNKNSIGNSTDSKI
uniref:Uncharacterized protein n=1 Tax=Ophiognomonia clavigignenti-juglandacearum TaxID=218668 RepID=A0A291LJ43_9PEZI|nr:hypothetical protein [Ophiognomonia clavigignenti-juglandacearum]